MPSNGPQFLFGHGLPAREISPDEQPWVVKLFIIVLGYATVIVPTFYLISYARRKYASGEPRTAFGRFLRSFAVGSENYQLLEVAPVKHQSHGGIETRSLLKDAIALLFFFAGIQCTLVMMGFLQERIITKGYHNIALGQLEQFGDAQFLVFCNRLVAIVVCAIVLSLTWRRQPPHAQPLYVHSFTSISNTMSTWCQYEALKYVSFPTQTICKTSKVVVTMLMGLVLRGQRYTWQEWICGGAVGIGASLFLLSSGRSRKEGVVTSVSGMLLMIGYLLFDSYTLNYQKKLFDKKPKISKYQMMMGVNVFSAILCAVSLLEQGTLFSSIDFALEHEHFFRDVFFLSLSGATGQLFIYSTIEKFGPIVFAVMMTIRQMLSILLSSFYYGHSLSSWSLVGFGVVFSAIFLDIYRRYFEKRRSVVKQ
ncbi:Udp-galactoseudp-glucose transporter 5 [Trichostrongylus colubriformis]|uniref:Adenosine 3'-phospho 5'-phosphosulfate transporter 1 n=1 Tax=Trichostrongylus colubriformis TaxID=6319 RepID=A0AAN8FDV9_TRICO